MEDIEEKPIEGYENYLVHREGYVTNKRTGRVLKTDISNRGYLRITVCKDNKAKKFSLHRLVAELFIPNPRNCETVNHKKTKMDNSYLDLEWMTQEENQRHAVENGLCPRGEESPTAKNKEGSIILICEMLQDGKTRPEIMKQIGVSKSLVDDIRRRKTWRHISSSFNW